MKYMSLEQIHEILHQAVHNPEFEDSDDLCLDDFLKRENRTRRLRFKALRHLKHISEVATIEMPKN